MKYIQPRPSSIVAALYTARDLGVDVAILHGPSGCSFKHARLLEEDGMRVLTTSLGENEFIFGGESRLAEVLAEAETSFAPRRMAVVGTCVAMIIGEDLAHAVGGVATPTIAVDIHAGFPENVDGVIATLQAAAGEGWIDEEELARQRHLLAAANEVERLRGAASRPYIEPERGALKHEAAARLLELARSGAPGIAVMNAKKETAYMFADALAALREAVPEASIRYLANLEERGLPKVRADARRIREELAARGVPVEAVGSLDEYGALGDWLGAAIRDSGAVWALIVGVPHAVPPEYTDDIEIFSITNGPRQVAPLRELGHKHVMVEVDLHPKTLGVRSIVESEFGAVLRSLA
ncbi:MAG: Ni-sirohydrochlorin a,c-diamide reductive cyclase catalytic subunit [Methanospirillum sp.]